MYIVHYILKFAMAGSYALCHNYGLAIFLFTFLSKLILLPLSIWVHKNSIKMVVMQPYINFIKAKFFGDKDRIAEEESKLFKRQKYNPMASIIPLTIQILLLRGIIDVIKAGIADPQINMSFIGIDLSLIPCETGGSMVLSPVLTGLSALIMCAAQNASNVLQAEQPKANQYGTLALSVGLSVYLGWFVPAGVALYWISSNLMAVAQLYLLNWAINPKNYVDYERYPQIK
ncbi:MAG: YidC/Oxa1 family membrane protein insertase [Lachnospiraceae bacterium]|jgi:YidC/Oxa1 family membrane protein insertase|nr:YidC/Oxa1 family membrane protein insertase [Lachnospiraceae bacterium]